MRSRTLRVDWANSSLRNRLTIGVLVLSAIGFVGAGVGSQALLRDYLINQVDAQLLSVVAGTQERLDRAGIEEIAMMTMMRIRQRLALLHPLTVFQLLSL
jgi:hypothetical protein